MKRLPKDVEILEAIYTRYYDDFRSYVKDKPDQISRIRVPIDVNLIAKDCGLEEEMVFGRLYYHFNKKYSYKNENGERTTFFSTIKFEGMGVNFPLVASTIAELRTNESQEKKFEAALIFSMVALLLSVVSIFLVLYS